MLPMNRNKMFLWGSLAIFTFGTYLWMRQGKISFSREIEAASVPQASEHSAVEPSSELSPVQNNAQTLTPEQEALIGELAEAKDVGEIVERLHRLRDMPFSQALDSVLRFQQENDPMIVRGVIQTLGSLALTLNSSDRQRVISVLDQYRQRFSSDHDGIERGHRYSVAKALGHIPEEEASEILKEMLAKEKNNLPGLYLVLENLKKLGVSADDPAIATLRSDFSEGKPPADSLERETWLEVRKLLDSW